MKFVLVVWLALHSQAYAQRYRYPVCSPEDFRCRNGTCVSYMKRCDLIKDCPDGEDEENCQCSENAYRCDGQCITQDKRCDGRRDCSDGSDEANCQTGNCLDNQWMCADGRCIELSRWCDMHTDCLDGTDEKNCTCPSDWFMCNNKAKCVPKSYRCDGTNDCNDRSDEIGCPNDCEDGKLLCPSGIGCFTPGEDECNGIINCSDGSDEANCSCQPHQFTCSDRKCISASKRCNNETDCDDGSDEEGCPSVCFNNEFRCRNGVCINAEYVCDGIEDCVDGSDESDCSHRPCPPENFRCGDNKCISPSLKCDRHVDCADGSDEDPKLCRSTCSQDEFQCNNGDCIPLRRRCDGVPDCYDNSDETNNDCAERYTVVDLVPGGHISSMPGNWIHFTCSYKSPMEVHARIELIYSHENNIENDNSFPASRRGSFHEMTYIPLTHEGVIRETVSVVPELQRVVCKVYNHKYDVLGHSVTYISVVSVPTTPRPACHSSEFTCATGMHCIPHSQVCDSRQDCPDGSDEANCILTTEPYFVTCRQGEFRCSDNRHCIPYYQHCDNVANCPDGSDEDNCAGMPLPNLKVYERDQIIKESREAVFQCRDEGPGRYRVKWTRENGLPLPPGSRNTDGRLEMPNVQREHTGTYYCEALGVPHTMSGARVSAHLTVEPLVLPTRNYEQACSGQGEATCYNRQCILKSQVCDGVLDCSDGSDETRCQNAQLCEPNEFRCHNRKCILKTWRCDKDDDCGDNSDELGCEIRKPGSQCFETEFECHSRNQCIPRSFQCDGTNDCQDNSDEIGCYAMRIVQTPPPFVLVPKGSTMVLVCVAVGVPVPDISWRKDWRHVPTKCTQTSTNGTGTLTCPNFQVEDNGAYTCEAMNSITYIISPQDTIAQVNATAICERGTFNDMANNTSECIKCFCFGASTNLECQSSNLYVYQLRPPSDIIVKLVNVHITPTSIQLRRDEDYLLQSSIKRIPDGFSVRSPYGLLSRQEYDNEYVYYALPEQFHGNQLNSYGGYISYTVQTDSRGGNIVNIPNIIITGNKRTLIYKNPYDVPENYPTKISAQFLEGRDWFLLTERGEEFARREDIMMTLVNVENILIRVQYFDSQKATTISNIVMDSAQRSNTNLGKASLVEQCTCPAGYRGLSCEECDTASNYTRVQSPPWLGRCEQIPISCPFGTFGDPLRGIPCEPCPCPHGAPPNQFTQQCYLDTDGRPTCVCPPGYNGRRCESCSEGYEGDPTQPGDYCKKAVQPPCDPAGSVSRYPINGVCECKANVVGPNCTECAPNTFHLSSWNEDGCTNCFCMGITKECRSSNLCRNQITARFDRDDLGFRLAPEDDISNIVPTNVEQNRLNSDNFQSKVYYWILPPKFLGNQLTSYGGNLIYTLRYVPSPGGLSSRNNAADVKLFSKSRINLYFYRNGTLEPDRDQTVTIPLVEKYWRREDGGFVGRENFLMALADIDDIFIKATYTTSTQQASLVHVYMDSASSGYSGCNLAQEVEDCQCPVGYKGLSCESCDAGYKKANEGVYLGLCEKCDCNGRSEECDPETGICRNCRDNYSGPHCEICRDGFEERNGICVPSGAPPTCYCDPRGEMIPGCPNGQCECKVNVEGPYCDRCREGTFNLSAEDTRGCTECYCSGVSSTCRSSNLYYEPLPFILNELGNHGFVLTNRNGQLVASDGFILNPARNEIGYPIQQSQNEFYWSLPSNFTGDKVTSYGGNLIYTQRVTFTRNAYILPDVDVILNGKVKSIYWENFQPQSTNQPEFTQNVVIPLKEGVWRRTDPRTGHSIATRQDILEVLSDLSSILIRASFGPDTVESYLSDVALDTTIPSPRGGRQALGVESCVCPPLYKGTSCEQCIDDHYYKAYDKTCRRCECNNREVSCSLGANNELHCVCQPGYEGKRCELKISGTMVELVPGGHISSMPGAWIHFTCSYRSPEEVYAKFVFMYWPERMVESDYHFSSRRQRLAYEGTIEKSAVVERELQKVICVVYNRNNDEVGHSVAFISAQLTPDWTTPAAIPPPSIEISITDPQPSLLIKQVGSTVRYRCTGTSRTGSDVRLSWSRLGADLPRGRASDDYQGNLEIVDLRVSDSGTYICTATDGRTSYTKSVSLQVGAISTIPKVQLSPPRVEVYEGEPIEINCYARGSPLPSLEWRRIDNDTFNPNIIIRDGYLRIPYASKSDEGTYECIARNVAGSMSETIKVHVTGTQPPPPQPISISPPSAHAVLGEQVILNCGGATSPDAEVVWSRQDGRHYSAQKIGNQLVFSSSRPEDTGIYICIVRSRTTGRIIGQAQASITISTDRPVSYPIVEPKQQRVPQGLTAEFVCNVPYDNYSGQNNVRWFKVDGEISPRAEYLNSGRTLRIPFLTIEDRGIYVCYSVYRGRSYNISAMLEVDRREKPSIELYPSDRRQILSVGNSLLLQCRVEGIPVPVIRWSKADNMPLPPHIVSGNSGTLRFNQVRLSDAGEYICTAENEAGKETASAYIEVQSPPEIVVYPSDRVSLIAGENLDLTCVAEGSPTPTVQWTKQDPSNLQLYEPSSINDIRAPPSFGRAEYQILQVSSDDEGIYYCVARNDAEAKIKAVQVTVDDFRPPDPSRPTGPVSPPDIPEDFWIASGADGQISCAEGIIQYERNWVRADQNPLPPGVSQRDGTLYIRAASKLIEGEYVCLIYDENRNLLRSLRQHISVKELPEITLHPPRQVVRPGDDAEITCTARGEQPIEVTWVAASHPLPPHVQVSGGRLSFRGITENDAGRYICRAKNVAGLRESSADVIVENIHNNRQPRVRISGEKVRKSIQGSTIALHCSSDIPSQVYWSRSNGSLPPSSFAEGDTLRIMNLQPYHSGQYVCSTRSPTGHVSSDYVELIVTRDCLGGFQCRNGECVHLSNYCDGVSQCADESDEIGCPRRRRGTVHIRLKIEPSIDIIRVGSTVDLRCITEGIPSSSIEWTKLGKVGEPEQDLGSNVQTISASVLRIVDVTTSNAGTYRCSAQTESGRYTDDYTLKVQDNSLSDSSHPQNTAAKKILLKVGDSTSVPCLNDLEPPVTYSWLRQGGLPTTATTNEGTLTLNNVSLRDVGLYTCIATNGEVKMEIPTFIVVHGTIPRFSSQSYIKLKTLFDAYMQFDIEILFKPESPNGLILYNGRQASSIGGSDFISFGLRNGYPEFKFDMGSGHATIVGRSPLPMGKWAKAKLNRNRKEGRLIMNDEEPVIGTSQGRHQGLDLDLPLYVGAVPDFNEISKSAEFNTGFRGCISRLVIKNEEQNLTRAESLDWVGILECETCAENLCTNSGACQEAPNARGYTCLCPKGFSGENCDRTGESCYPGLCGDGYCENTEKGYVCKCPLGLAGSNCEHRIKIRTPSFDDTSYIAYPAPRNTGKLDITLKLNPSDSRDALILYAAQNDFGTGNYISISIKDRRLEFRIDTGSGSPVVLKSNTEIIPGSWMTVTAGRDTREAKLSIGHDEARTTLTSGQRREVLLGTFLYLGGFDTSTGSVNPNVGVSAGFRGCISYIDISRMDIDILRSAKESSNIGECPSGNPCRESPCRNGATCVVEGAGYACMCTPEYSGIHCEKLKNDCERFTPCGGKGECVPLAHGYKCHCTKGFSGQNCTIREYFTTSFSMEGDGWVELPKSMLADVGDDTEVELNIVTEASNGILLWHGQGPATAGGITDFFSIAVVNGRIEVVFELGSGLGQVVSDVQVNDGLPHRIIVTRRGNYATLAVDGKTTDGQSEGFLSKLNANGNIYIGGVPDPTYMTNGRYFENFNGCIRNIRIQNSDVIDVSNTAISTVNLRRCPVSSE